MKLVVSYRTICVVVIVIVLLTITVTVSYTIPIEEILTTRTVQLREHCVDLYNTAVSIFSISITVYDHSIC